ncbi:holo-ACP synthase [Candidatus Phytoplasma australiense]|uniref:Holo-[acyl-carrier-protein] synthase n=1 Tax=Strawberry lethal yellows phytoplasma (CPA) str. NZSb11 TaxID=980422 RepID=R4RR94_PHYAS|nr:holo-ACP synthase [Candidatus Phytoplasma australiense]AGL91031.1 Holo-[acyl-carrier-protein] synthase [Strawberry lethal yellows phytoplasma (CPA) str. NZSb11]
MNVQNIGIDLVEIKKIQKIGIQVIATRILSSQEKKFFLTFCNQERQLTFLGGRWAAKEALFKALTAQNLNNSQSNYHDWSILNDSNNAPYLENPQWKNRVLLSITHTHNYALAMVLILQKEKKL